MADRSCNDNDCDDDDNDDYDGCGYDDRNCFTGMIDHVQFRSGR